MALSNHKRDTLKRFDKLKILEHDLALSSEKSQDKTSQASQKPEKTKV